MKLVEVHLLKQLSVFFVKTLLSAVVPHSSKTLVILLKCGFDLADIFSTGSWKNYILDENQIFS